MNDVLLDTCLRVLALADGLDEPVFDEHLRVTNWPSNVAAEVEDLVEAIYRSGNAVQLRSCVEVLKGSRSPNVPEGLRRVLSHALFDNPATPLSER